MFVANSSSFRAAQILLKVGELSRRVRSWPLDTLIGAFCPTFRALSDAPISVANGHDLGPLPSSPIVEQNLSSSETAQIGNDKVWLRFQLLRGVPSFGKDSLLGMEKGVYGWPEAAHLPTK